MQSAWLALGDSYTIGEGVAANASWPAQLAARLHGCGIDVGEPRIIATTGWTTDELSAAMDAAAFDVPYALVTFSIGVNNQYRGRPLHEYRAQFRALLQRAVALAGGDASRVLAVSIPDWSVTPFARTTGCDPRQIGQEIDVFNDAARAETAALGARFVNVAAVSRSTEARGELAADGLHPSAAQYARWVDAILPAAREILLADA
ncbi:MAG: SGNH/GDSL hydrolase family protein [Rhodanobacteraceae bacterium]